MPHSTLPFHSPWDTLQGAEDNLKSVLATLVARLAETRRRLQQPAGTLRPSSHGPQGPSSQGPLHLVAPDVFMRALQCFTMPMCFTVPEKHSSAGGLDKIPSDTERDRKHSEENKHKALRGGDTVRLKDELRENSATPHTLRRIACQVLCCLPDEGYAEVLADALLSQGGQARICLSRHVAAECGVWLHHHCLYKNDISRCSSSCSSDDGSYYSDESASDDEASRTRRTGDTRVATGVNETLTALEKLAAWCWASPEVGAARRDYPIHPQDASAGPSFFADSDESSHCFGWRSICALLRIPAIREALTVKCVVGGAGRSPAQGSSPPLVLGMLPMHVLWPRSSLSLRDELLPSSPSTALLSSSVKQASLLATAAAWEALQCVLPPPHPTLAPWSPSQLALAALHCESWIRVATGLLTRSDGDGSHVQQSPLPLQSTNATTRLCSFLFLESLVCAASSQTELRPLRASAARTSGVFSAATAAEVTSLAASANPMGSLGEDIRTLLPSAAMQTLLTERVLTSPAIVCYALEELQEAVRPEHTCSTEELPTTVVSACNVLDAVAAYLLRMARNEDLNNHPRTNQATEQRNVVSSTVVGPFLGQSAMLSAPVRHLLLSNRDGIRVALARIDPTPSLESASTAVATTTCDAGTDMRNSTGGGESIDDVACSASVAGSSAQAAETVPDQGRRWPALRHALEQLPPLSEEELADVTARFPE